MPAVISFIMGGIEGCKVHVSGVYWQWVSSAAAGTHQPVVMVTLIPNGSEHDAR